MTSLRSIDSSVDLTHQHTYVRAQQVLSQEIAAHTSAQEQAAVTAANTAAERLEELRITHDQCLQVMNETQRGLEEAQAALTITTDGLDQARELATLAAQYAHLGPIKVGGSVKRLQDDIDRAAKLLLLKLSDLRQAGELVKIDLGRFDVNQPDGLVTKLVEVSEALEELARSRRATRDHAKANMGELVQIFDTVILSDASLDQAVNSPWLPKERATALFEQYRELEELYRATINEHRLRS